MDIKQLESAIKADLNILITPPNPIANKFPMIYAIEFYGKDYGIGVILNFTGQEKAPRRIIEKVTNLMNAMFGYELVKHIRTLQTYDFVQESLRREKLLFKTRPIYFID